MEAKKFTAPGMEAIFILDGTSPAVVAAMAAFDANPTAENNTVMNDVRNGPDGWPRGTLVHFAND